MLMSNNCKDCKYAVQVAEHEFECNADQYDIDEKTCFVPRGVADEYFKPINRIARNSDVMSTLLAATKDKGVR